MKTIAIFSGYALPHLGGIERYIDNLSRELINRNYKVIIISSNFNKSDSFEEKGNLINIRIPIYNMFKNRYPLPRKNKEYRNLIKKLDEYKIDRIIVNTRFHLTSHIGAKYGKKRNIPVYLIEHGSNYVTLDNKFIDFFANRYEDYLTRRIKKKITGFYGVSQSAAKWLIKFGIKSDGVWYNSIDINQSLPDKKKHNGVNFLYAGRLIKQKGVLNILNAFSELEKEYKNITLYIAGDGPEMNDYKNEFKSKNIHFLGRLNYNQLVEYYSITDVFLYPPLWPEGLPTSLLEAGLMKCCVIGTMQGGIVEVINKNNGILVNGDTKSLVKAMKESIDDNKKCNKLSLQLYNDIKKNFSWNVTVDKIINDIKL